MGNQLLATSSYVYLLASRILKLQKDREKMEGLAQLEQSSELTESPRASTAISAKDLSAGPSTPASAQSIEAKDDSVRSPDDGERESTNSTTTPVIPTIPDQTSATKSVSVKRRTPISLGMDTPRRIDISEDVPMKSPFRSANSIRSIQMDETRLDTQLPRMEGTYRPMSPALSARMQHMNGAKSPRIPSGGSQESNSGYEEIERVNVPRRQRLRQLSHTSVASSTSKEPEHKSTSLDEGLRSPTTVQGPLKTDELHQCPAINVDNVSVEVDPVDNDITRIRTPDEVVSDARIVTADMPGVNTRPIHHSESGNTLAEIADRYYTRSSMSLPLNQAEDEVVDHMEDDGPVTTSARSPASIYDDVPTTDRSQLIPKAKNPVLLLEPAAEFNLASPGTSNWQEQSPERLRQVSTASSNLSVQYDHARAASQIDFIIMPHNLRDITLRVSTILPYGLVCIAVLQTDMHLVHKLHKTHDCLSQLERGLATTLEIALPTREELESIQPAVINASRSTIGHWLQMLQAKFQDKPPTFDARLFCNFLSTDIADQYDDTLDVSTSAHENSANAASRSASLSSVGNVPTSMTGEASARLPTKEGYLSKRGKNFGGWKQRYFILDGPTMRYYEHHGGQLLDSIKLPQAQIGIYQHNAENTAESDSLQHAFLILEPKKKNTSNFVRHVLCSNSDYDRDEWIRALLPYATLHHSSLPLEGKEASKAERRLAKEQQKEQKKNQSKTTSIGSTLLGTPTRLATRSEKQEEGTFLGAIGYNETVPGRQPLFESAQAPPRARSDTLDTNSIEQHEPPIVSISGPMNGAPIDNNLAWGAPAAGVAKPSMTSSNSQTFSTDKKNKKKSFWAFGKSGQLDNSLGIPPRDFASSRSPSYNDVSFASTTTSSVIFGQSLTEAISMSNQCGLDVGVPSVIYRCIQYLDKRQVDREEGIYRLSGSNTVIRGLKERFNNDTDVDLVNSGEYFDVHAIAGLLKLYLRELPSSILTRDLQLDFLDIIDMPEGQARMITLRTLVQSLPRPNFDLLRILSRHLRAIVDNAEQNKMTLRNVGIVFSPTLNIPAGVFSLFIAEYEAIFGPRNAIPEIHAAGKISLSSITSPTSQANSEDAMENDHSYLLLAQQYANGNTPAPPAHSLHPGYGDNSAMKKMNRNSGMVGLESYKYAEDTR